MKKIVVSALILINSLNSFTVDTIYIPMRDGILLAATIYYPDTFPFPRPVILQRTPYERNIDDSLLLQVVVDYMGYVIISQNLRGRYDSQGEPLIFMSDGWGPLRDGFDTIEWIADSLKDSLGNPICNGKIGMVGGSAPGMTQYYAAGSHPPSLDVLVPMVAGPSIYHHVAFNGGVYRKALVETWLNGVGTPWLIDTVVNHPNYETMWSWVDLTSRWDSAPYPMYHVTGWFDLYTDGQLEAFSELQSRFGKQKLFVGPWGHYNFGGREQGDLLFPPNAELNPAYAYDRLIRWYNYFLYDDTTNGILDEPPVRFYLMGDCDIPDTSFWNKWIDAYTWPLPEVSYKNFYLRAGGLLDTLPPTTTEPADTYMYNPLNPTPTIGGREYIGIPYDSITGLGGYGPRDQRPIENRPDVLVYTTPPFSEPVAVIGKIIMVLYASSDRYDTDFAVRVTDVYPDGRSILLTDNILMARHRHGLDRVDSLIPGVPDTFYIDVWSTANVFNTGHRLRVIISSANYPRFERNPNHGGPFQRNDTLNALPATNVVYHSATMPSHLKVPIVPFPYPKVGEKLTLWTGKNNEINIPTLSKSPHLTLNLLQPESVEINIFDISGRRIKEIYKGKLSAGIHRWKITPNSSGVYFISLKAGKNKTLKKILFIR